MTRHAGKPPLRPARARRIVAVRHPLIDRIAFDAAPLQVLSLPQRPVRP